jgi:hypothetical protein
MPVCRGANPEPYWLIIRLRRCLATWALAAARGVPVRKVPRQRGWSKSTFYRKLDGGAARIAAILGLAQELKKRARALAKPTEEKIRKRTQEIWEENDRPVGRDVEFWLQAEREFREAERFGKRTLEERG